MNRFLLASALAFGLTAGASAQNAATTTQTGDENDARVNQTAASTAVVNQTESGLVNPPNPGNLVILDQSASTATVTQQTDASGDAYSNAAQLQQSDGSQATVTQSGIYNWVTGDLDRIGPVRPGDGNLFVQQSSRLTATQTGTSNTVEGSQTGFDQSAIVVQDGRFNTATLDQASMNESTATITQTGDSSPPVSPTGVTIEDRQRAEVTQTGLGDHRTVVTQTSVVSSSAAPNQGSNMVDLDQDGSAQTATVGQTGYDNTATAEQTEGYNVLEADQLGDANVLTVSQDGSSNDILGFEQIGDANVATMTQDGDDNQVDVAEQRGDRNTLTILQDGDRNQAGVDNGPAPRPDAIDQRGDDNVGELTQLGDDNVVFLEQFGDGNNALVTQGKAGRLAFDNVASVEQVGDLNDVDIDVQAGSRNELSVYQEGNSNRAGILNGSAPMPDAVDQQGDDNVADLDQLGDDNVMYLEQFGDDNRAVMLQTGNTNRADVFQMGNDDTATITQTGNGNTATVSQSGTVVQ